jgi:hypothetical protein
VNRIQNSLAGRPVGWPRNQPGSSDAAELDALRDAWHAERPDWPAGGRIPPAAAGRAARPREHRSVLAEARERGRGPDDLLALLRQHRLTERRRPPAAHQ